MSEMLPLRDKARKNTNACSRKNTKNFGWTVLPYPTYIPDITPLYCHLFGRFKIAARTPLYQTRGTHGSGCTGGRVTSPGGRLSTKKETTLKFSMPSAKPCGIVSCPTFKQHEIKIRYIIF
jgi:hypothetical protein